MRKWMTNLMIFLPGFCLMTMSAESKNCKLDIGAGYRQDHLEWEIGGPANVPKVMSKLTWKNIRIFDVEAQFRKITCQNIYFRANADYGWIFDGENRDSDFRVEEGKQSTRKTVEYSRSDNKASKGGVYDASAGLGYFIRMCMGSRQLRFAPIGGYSIHEQHLRLFKGFQTIDLNYPVYEGHHFPGLKSSYNARWYGPWAGLDTYCHFNDEITLSGTFEYHWLHFHGKGHWNLREDILGDFIQTGFGRGYFGTIALDYNFCSGWYMGALCKFNYAKIENGRDKTVVCIPMDTNIKSYYRKSKTTKLKQSTKSQLSQESPIDANDHNQSFLTFDTVTKLRNVRWYSFSFIFTVGYNF